MEWDEIWKCLVCMSEQRSGKVVCQDCLLIRCSLNHRISPLKVKYLRMT